MKQIIVNLQELHEIAAQLVSSLEECIEMSGEEGELPQAGFIFEEIAEVNEFTYLFTIYIFVILHSFVSFKNIFLFYLLIIYQLCACTRRV